MAPHETEARKAWASKRTTVIWWLLSMALIALLIVLLFYGIPTWRDFP